MANLPAPPLLVDVKKFLGRFFTGISSGNANRVWVAAAYDATHPMAHKSHWAGGFTTTHIDELSNNHERTHYYCEAILKPGSPTRADRHFEAGIVIVLDDVGLVGTDGRENQVTGSKLSIETLMFLPEPSFVVETSHGNFQVAYVITPPEKDYLRWSCFKKGLREHPIFGVSGREGRDNVHYWRTPTGTATKSTRGSFQTKYAKPFTGVTYTLDQLAKAFDIDISAKAISALVSSRKVTQSRTGGEKLSGKNLRDIMELLPNKNLPYDDWIDMGLAMWGATDGSEEGRDVWTWWSATSSKDDPQSTYDKWDTFSVVTGSSATTLRRRIEEKHGPDSEARAKAGAIFMREETSRTSSFGDTPDQARIKTVETETQASMADAPITQNVVVGDIYEPEDPKTIPPREWLYGDLYIRKFVTGLVAPGGAGKTSLSFIEALAMATGRDLIGVEPRRTFNVSVWNGEDPEEELRRRLGAACLHYGITKADLGGRFRLKSSRQGEKLTVATLVQGGVKVQRPVMDKVVAEIRATNTDVLMIDPFISSHQVPENSNDAIEIVTKEWLAVAEQTGCCVLLVHHLRKLQPGTELTADDARGASAWASALRVLRLAEVMDKNTALKWGITDRKAYFRTINGKNSMAPVREDNDWYRFKSVGLGNAVMFPADGGKPIAEDRVGVVLTWKPPLATASVTTGDLRKVQAAIAKAPVRASEQSQDWVGKVIGNVLGLDVDSDDVSIKAPARAKVRGLIKEWLKDGYLKKVTGKDEKDRPRPEIAVGIFVLDEFDGTEKEGSVLDVIDEE